MSGRIIIYIIVWLVLASIGYSCKSTQDVSSEKILQKRKYRSGFYVNNHKRAKLKKDDLIFLNQEISSVEELVVEGNLTRDPIRENDNAQIKKTNIAEKFNPKDAENNLEILLEDERKKPAKLDRKLVLNKNKKGSILISDDPPQKKTELNGLLGFIFALLGVVSLIISLIISGFSAIPIFAVFLVVVSLGLILSLISLKRFKNFPNQYRGKDFAEVGLWISVLSLIVGGIILLLVL